MEHPENREFAQLHRDYLVMSFIQRIIQISRIGKRLNRVIRSLFLLSK